MSNVGRPSKSEKERLSVRLMTALTICEADVIYKNASREGMTVSEYIRRIIVRRVQDQHFGNT